MRPALPTQMASPWPNPRTLLLVACLGFAVLLLVLAAAGVLPTVRRAGASVTQTASTPATVVETARSGRSSLSTTYEGPASCAEPGFLIGDTIGDANPAAMYRTLCGSAN